MDLAEEIKILAFLEVRNKTLGYSLRTVYRWYSREFATPLHLVHTLPYTEVLQAYFEDQFENMSEDELEDARVLLIETDGQREVRLAEEERLKSSEAAFLKFAADEAKRLETTKVPEQVPVREVAHPHKAIKDVQLPVPKEIPPDVTVKFVDDNFFEDMMDDLDNKGGGE